MTTQLPKFKYHPDPIATKTIQPSQSVCDCCGEVRGYIYSGPVYATEDLAQSICPWCISDGNAAEKFDAMFSDDHSLAKAKLDNSIIDEVTLRTPGYISWQSDEWLSHCNDACEFHGDASIDDISSVSKATKEDWLSRYQHDESSWQLATKNYVPGGDSAFYKFICRHCQIALLGWDIN